MLNMTDGLEKQLSDRGSSRITARPARRMSVGRRERKPARARHLMEEAMTAPLEKQPQVKISSGRVAACPARRMSVGRSEMQPGRTPETSLTKSEEGVASLDMRDVLLASPTNRLQLRRKGVCSSERIRLVQRRSAAKDLPLVSFQMQCHNF